MSMFTKSQFLQMQFDHTPWAADRLRESGEPYSLNAAFVQTQTRAPGGEPFTGQAGDAAQDKGETIAGALNRFHAETDNAANVLKAAHEMLWPAAWNLRTSINAASGPVVIKDGGRLAQLPVAFYVTEDWKIQADLSRWSGSLTQDQNEAITAWLQGAQEGLDKNREALEQASDKAAADLRANVHFEQVANDGQIGSLVGETPAQAKADVAAYLAGTATPEQKARVKKALELDPSLVQQMRDGKSGHVGAEQNSVLRAFADQTRGMGLDQLQALANRPGDDGRVFAEGVNDIMNPHLSCPVPDPARPNEKEAAFGGADMTPRGIAELGNLAILDRPSPDGYRSLAGIVGKVPPEQLAGSGLTQRALDGAKQLAQYGQNASDPKDRDTDLGAAQALLSSAGRDVMSVHDQVQGEEGKKFIDTLERTQWTDGGAALSTLTKSALDEADGGPNASAAQAVRAGQVEHAFFSELAANKGSVDPHGAFAKSMTDVAEKYMPAMFGHPPDAAQTTGFGTLERGSPDEAVQYKDTKAALGVLCQDEENAKRIGGRLGQEKIELLAEYQDAIRKHPGAMGPDDEILMSKAGSVEGVMSRLAADVALEEKKSAYDVRAMWFDNGKDIAVTLAGETPAGALVAALGANWAKMEFLGDPPSVDGKGPLPIQTLYALAGGFQPAGGTMPADLPPYLQRTICDAQGHLLSWNQIEQNMKGTSADGQNLPADSGTLRAQLEAYLQSRLTPTNGARDMHGSMDEYQRSFAEANKK